jgi:hypothetical protein
LLLAFAADTPGISGACLLCVCLPIALAAHDSMTPRIKSSPLALAADACIFFSFPFRCFQILKKIKNFAVFKFSLYSNF